MSTKARRLKKYLRWERRQANDLQRSGLVEIKDYFFASGRRVRVINNAVVDDTDDYKGLYWHGQPPFKLSPF